VAKHLLSARQVQTASVGELRDGAGLILRVKAKSASWIFPFTAPSGRRRELGLGSADRASLAAAGVSLKRARKKADEARDLLDRTPPVDPIDAKAADRQTARKAEAERKAAAKAERATLCRVARAYHESAIEPSRTYVHSKEWIASLERHVPKRLWSAPIDEVTAPELLAALADVVARYPETGRRVRQRLEAVFDDAQFHGLCGSNPATSIRRKLSEGRRALERGRFRALSYKELPAFLAELRKVEGISARALEFAVLCAARTSEIRFARWAEFDMEREVWTVPAARMKGKQEHLVHLSDRAMELLKGQRGIGEEYVFPSPTNVRKPLSSMGMLMCLRRLGVSGKSTVHGMARASFSTWAYEAAGAREEIVEACLAHKEADRVRAAYDRSQHHAARRRLLQTWADYCAGAEPTSNVIEGDFRASRPDPGGKPVGRSERV
jgi:integrase